MSVRLYALSARFPFGFYDTIDTYRKNKMEWENNELNIRGS